MTSTIIYTDIYIFGSFVILVSLWFYFLPKYKEVCEVTRRQLVWPIPVSIFLFVLTTLYYYFDLMYKTPHFFYFLVDIELGAYYFFLFFGMGIIIAGRRNMRKKYNIDVTGMGIKKIKKLKELELKESNK